MHKTSATVLGLALAVVTALPAVAQEGGTLDDQSIAALLEVHRDTGAALVDVQRELDQIPLRIESDDWLVFPGRDGDLIEVNLDEVKGLLPAESGLGGRASIVCEGMLKAALEPPYTNLTPEQITACFRDCDNWISWHANFGDALPTHCAEIDPDTTPVHNDDDGA